MTVLKDFIDQVSGIYTSCLDSVHLSDFRSVWHEAQADMVRFAAQITEIESARAALPSLRSREGLLTHNLWSYP